MPFTAFHLGPGSLAKSVAPRWFSFRAFALNQVVIDCETAWNIYREHARLHTFFHSYLGVFMAMILTATLLVVYSWFALQFPKAWLIRELEDWGLPFQFRSSLTAVLLGGWSHVFLDSVVHADMQPYAPFSNSNAMLDFVSVDMLHMACLWNFAGAGLVWGIRVTYRNMRENLMRRK